MNRPVKKVENHTYNLKYGTIDSASRRNSGEAYSATQYVTPETLTTVPPQRPPIRNSEDTYDRRKISTFLAGVIPDTFAVEF